MGCGRSRSATPAQVRPVKPLTPGGATSNQFCTPGSCNDNACVTRQAGGGDNQLSDVPHATRVSCEEADAQILDGITSSLEDIVQTAIRSCQDRSMLQLFDAEKILMDAIEAIDLTNPSGRNERLVALDILRRSSSYRDVLARLQAYEDRICFALQSDDEIGEGEEWKEAASVPIDYKALGMELSPEADKAVSKEDRTIGIYIRTVQGKTHLRIRMLLPLKLVNIDQSISVVEIWNALLAEFQLWHTYHPLVVGNGPVELTPKSPYYSMLQILFKVLIFKIAAVNEVYTMFNFDSGAEMFVMEDLRPDSPVRAQYPPPTGYRMGNDVIQSTTIMIPQQHTLFGTTVMVMEFEKPPPQWALSWFCSWCMPELVRRMFRSGVKSVSGDGPHRTAIREDATGLYAAVNRFVNNAVERDVLTRTAPYTPRNPPKAEVIASRARSLTKFDASASWMQYGTDAEEVAGGRGTVGEAGEDCHVVSI